MCKWCKHLTECILALEIANLNTETQWGEGLVKKPLIEPELTNMAKGDESKMILVLISLKHRIE